MPDMNPPALPDQSDPSLDALLFNAHPQAQWLVDEASGRLLAVNEAALRLTGLTRAQFLDSTTTDIRCADGRALDGEQITRALQIEGRPARLVVAQAVTYRHPG